MSRPTCATCPWWVGRDDIPAVRERVPEGRGESRVRAPTGCSVIISTEGATHSSGVIYAFGITHKDDFCGEHPGMPAWLAAREKA